MLAAVSRWALIGAAAALLVALADFGASWLWLPETSDRIALALRLLALEVPAGALLGAVIGVVSVVGVKPTRRLAARFRDAARWERRLWPAPYLVLASPAFLAIAWLLFSGAAASHLPMRPLLVAVAALALFAAAYVALRVGRAIALAAPSMPAGKARFVVIGLFALSIVLAKIDQYVFPGLYQYLHALLAMSAWLVDALIVTIFALRSKRGRTIERRAPALGLTATALLIGVLVLDILTLGANQTVRVALLSPRASVSRSLMLALGPALALSQRREAADALDRARRARRQRQGRAASGPVLEDAHVLLVTIDALRADHLGLYGYRTRPVSPELDRFAEQSVVFDLAYAQAPHSSYSISSLMTSGYLYQSLDLGLPLPEETIASVMRAVGRHCAAFYIDGIFHTDGERFTRYRENDFAFGRVSHRNSVAEAKTDEVLSEIDRIVEAGEPSSFIWAHYFDVHEPYRDTSFGTTDVERYDGEIRNVDRALARLVREARARLERPVIVVVTADHGEEFRDHGGVYHGSTVYQEQIRVPLIMNVPGVEPRRVAHPVELVDVAPTILALVGVPAAPSMRGDDLRGLLVGDDGSDLGPAFGSVGTKHMVVAWPHKLIADLRFGTYELYDLTRDPRERQNLADDQRREVDALSGELHAWLDALGDTNDDPYAVALYRGRLRDRSAAPGLSTLMLDESADGAMRAEAARLLSRLSEPEVVASLRRATRSPVSDVAAEASISLGWLGERSARRALRTLIDEGPLERRVRAAIGLGRLEDHSAMPVLIEALPDEDLDIQLRYEAIRLLGLSRDPQAIDPLLDLLDDMRLRRRAVLALGRIGDERAFDPVLEQLEHAEHTTVREASARALGQIGDARAVPHLVAAALRDRLPSVGESLVRLHAVGRAIGGLDVRPGAEGEGLGECSSLPPGDEDSNYLNRTYCETSGDRVVLPLALPSAVRDAREVVMLVRVRRVDAGYPIELRVSLGEHALETARVDGEWTEVRFTVPTSSLDASVTLSFDGGARLAIDHVLLVPSSS